MAEQETKPVEEEVEGPGLPGEILALLDPHRAAETAEEEPEVPPTKVALFDPSSPAKPRLELAVNFDPHQHVRWEFRPSVAELDLASIEVEEGKTLLPAGAVEALRAAHLVNLKALLRAGQEGLRAVPGLGRKGADDLYAWASSRHAAQYALAELKAESPKAAPKPPPAPAVPAPTPTASQPPVADKPKEGGE